MRSKWPVLADRMTGNPDAIASMAIKLVPGSHRLGKIAAFDAALAGMNGEQFRRRALYLIWQNPWMTISRDTYISKFLALAGWRTVAHNDVVRYPEVTIDDTLLDDVDDVLFSTEPYTFSEADLAAFAKEHPAHAAKARLIDAEMVSWYGSRAVAGLGYLKHLAMAGI